MNEPQCPPEALRSILRKAKEKLAGAKMDFEAGFYDDAASRSYYAVFHAMTATLAQKGLSFSSHYQTVGAFNREFVKTGSFPKETTRILQRLFKDRQFGDYSWTIHIDHETALQDITDAEWMIQKCQLLNKKSIAIWIEEKTTE